MINRKRLTFKVSALLATTTLLSACGGKSTSDQNAGIDETTHPVYSKALVRMSTNHQPSGEIKEKNPTFTWTATGKATTYLLGHEDTDSATRWTTYTVSVDDANCVIGTICSYKPQDLQLEVGDEKAWWVKPKTSSGWGDWSSTYVFKIIGSKPPQSVDAITPKGVINEASPTFKWTPGNGVTKYQIGMERPDASDWETHLVSASQANCSSTECSITPSGLNLTNGDQKTWWVRAFNNTWGSWSTGSEFVVDINTSYIPFKSLTNVLNITEVNGKWYGMTGKKILQDDGSDNVTTLHTAIKFKSGFIKSIPGKLYFVQNTNKGSTAHDITHGRGRKDSLMSLTIANNVVTDEMSTTSVSIGNPMKDYLIVKSYHKPSGRQPGTTTYYKLDKNSKQFNIGQSGSFGRRFSLSNSAINNVLIARQQVGARVKRSKVTDKINIGLEELAPFADMPNVKDIVLASNGAWYAIDSTNKKIVTSHGYGSSSSVYEAPTDFSIATFSEKNLVTGISRNNLLFIIQKTFKPSSGATKIRNASFLFYNTSSKTVKIVASYKDTLLKIRKPMKGYAYVSSQYLVYSSNPRAPRYPRKHLKIDYQGNLIALGDTKSLSYKSADETKNEVYFNVYTGANKKITDKLKVGLEDL